MTAPAKSSLSTISVCPFSAAIPRGTECGGVCGHEEKVTVNVEFMNNNKILSCNSFSSYISSSNIPVYLYRYKHNPHQRGSTVLSITSATFSLGVNTSCWSAMCSWLHTQCLYTLNESHRHLTLRARSLLEQNWFGP